MNAGREARYRKLVEANVGRDIAVLDAKAG